jgi:hypothetical protein
VPKLDFREIGKDFGIFQTLREMRFAMDGRLASKKTMWNGGNALRSVGSRMKVLDLLVLVTIASPDLWLPSFTFCEALPLFVLWFASPFIGQIPNVPIALRKLHSVSFRTLSSVLL